jgi:hypothetical protein
LIQAWISSENSEARTISAKLIDETTICLPEAAACSMKSPAAADKRESS